MEHCIIGMQRSGNHAVINWILSQSKGHAYFLSDVQAGANPFSTINEFEHYYDGRLVYRQNLWSQEEIRSFSNSQYGAELKGALRKKELLLYNFEDQRIDDILNEKFRERLPCWIGNSGKRYTILILRDPFNFLASRLRAGDRLTGIKDTQKIIDLWKEYANWFRINSLGNDDINICINFSRWHYSVEYRKEIARLLRLSFNDNGRQTVPDFLGSSFDGRAFNGKAELMNVNRRWEGYKSSEVFKSLYRDVELMAHAQDIFGDIPDVVDAIRLNSKGG